MRSSLPRVSRAGVLAAAVLTGCVATPPDRGRLPMVRAEVVAEPNRLLAAPGDPAVPPLTAAEALLGRLWGERAGLFSVVNPHPDSPAIRSMGDALIDPKLLGPRALPDRAIRLLAFHTTLAGRGTPGELFVTRHYRSAFTKDEFPADFQVTSFTLGETAPRPGTSAPCKVVGYAVSEPLPDGIAARYFAGNPLPVVALASVLDAGRVGLGVVCPEASDAWVGYRLAVVGNAGAPRLGVFGEAEAGRYAEDWFRFRPVAVKAAHMKHVVVEQFSPWPGWGRLDLWRSL